MKRFLDIFISLVSLIIFCPIFVLIAVMVKIKLGSPIIFTQSRGGLKGSIFRINKFRTMTNEFDNKHVQLSDNDRLTKFGNFLRSTSLDELPQLWNVLKGDMSLVGPRPLSIEYLPLYTNKQAKRHDVLPGITGWAQINGRNAISWEEKFDLDLWYVENHSISLDIKILFLTLKKVILREGINAKDNITAPIFRGSKNEKHTHHLSR